jgi:hypothetical protein
MRIAHIIMAHKNPGQLVRLVERLQHPQFDFYIHIDGKVPIDNFDVLTNKANIFFIKNRIHCNWGGWNFTKGIINSINEVIVSDKDYNFINLLSAQDYPIKAAGEIYDFFAQRQGENFIYYADEESEWWKEAADRYEKYHFTDLKIKRKYFFQKIVNKLAPKRKFPYDLKLYGGSNSSWWTISGECAKYVAEKLSSDQKLHNFLKYCWGTDEFVIITIIMNSIFKEKTVNDNLRYIDWSEGNAHPKFLDIGDFEEIRKSEMLFARKFDMDKDEAILNRIDEQCLNYLGAGIINP